MPGPYDAPVTFTAGRKEHALRYYRSDDGKASFVRLERGSDMLASLNEAAQQLGIEAGTVQAIGAVSELAVGFFRQEEQEYQKIPFPEHLEIGSALGNVSLKDGQPFIHMHVTATRPDGSTVGGHLMEGTKVFLLEAYFRELGGPPPIREQEEDLGLPVWQ
jgi:predicted DNA-binding protein with PD1-like motif